VNDGRDTQPGFLEQEALQVVHDAGGLTGSEHGGRRYARHVTRAVRQHLRSLGR
jgi:hypothetical protein